MVVTNREKLAAISHRAGPWLLFGLCVYWFLPAWIWHIRRTLDPFAFNDDARILIWPFLREADPSLFPNDPFIPYYLAGLPEGFLALYRVAGRLGWTIAVSEVLQYVSVISSVLLLAACARRLGGVYAGFLAAVLALGSATFFERAGGGLPRAFAFPLVSAGLYALVSARPLLLAVLTIAGAAFYPVVAALLGLSLALYSVLPEYLRDAEARSPRDHATTVTSTQNWPRDAGECLSSVRASGVVSTLKLLWGRTRLLGVTLVCVIALIIPMTLRLRPYGDAITEAMLPAFPEAGEGGRLSREHRPPYENFATVFLRHSHAALLGTGEPVLGRAATRLRGDERRTHWLVTTVVVAAVLSALRRSIRRPQVARAFILPLAALVGHAVACCVAPRLFIPERYSQYGVPPFVILIVATSFGRFSSDKTKRGASRLRAVLAFLLVGVLGGRATSYLGIEVFVPPEARPLYAAIAQLPRSAVVAGWPAGPVENIPYLSFRRVLSNFQLEMPFHAQFTLDSRARLQAFFEAYYATNRVPIERLCTEFHVTHILVDKMHFERTPPAYYEPHRSYVRRLFAEAEGKSIVVRELLSHQSTRHFDAGLSLIDLSAIPALAFACSSGHMP
jgi:hypothetical protein